MQFTIKKKETKKIDAIVLLTEKFTIELVFTFYLLHHQLFTLYDRELAPSLCSIWECLGNSPHGVNDWKIGHSILEKCNDIAKFGCFIYVTKIHYVLASKHWT